MKCRAWIKTFEYAKKDKMVIVKAYWSTPEDLLDDPHELVAWAEEILSMRRTNEAKRRCDWPSENPLMVAYHDTEWGVPMHDDRTLFEFLILEGAQAGLSWQTVLNKRENYRKAFDNFNAKKIARYGAKDVKRLLSDPGIIRNRLKIAATIQNAKKFFEIQKEFGSFDAYIWQFVGGKPINKKFKSLSEIPPTTKRIRCHEQRFTETRIQVRRPNDLLCFHGGSRHDQ